MQRWKLTIEYRGTAYAGWQRQAAGIPSVQLAVEEALFKFCQQRITLHVAGRTDAGVHARGQVAHFDLDYGARRLQGFDVMNALNAQLRPQPVAIIAAEKVAADFHARFQATNKLYCYRLLNRPASPALEAGLVWHIRRPLDVAAMRQGAAHLLGRHDFTTFRASDCQALSPVRPLERFAIDSVSYDGQGGQELRFLAEARSFLHHQVRNMVGTLVQVGDGRWHPDEVKTALEACDRAKGGPTAPPDGLALLRVDYATMEPESPLVG